MDLSNRPYRTSYSAIKKYLECPKAYAYEYIERRAAPPSAAMMRGTRLHKLAEDYMNADFSVPSPYDLKRVGLKLYQLREQRALPEAEWYVDANWNKSDKDHAKIKAVVDVHRLNGDILKLHDYKSGREYPSHQDQLEFYSAIGLCVYPDAKRVEASCIYFDSGHEGTQRSIIRDMLPYFRTKWSGYIERMDNDVAFAPTAGGHCARCPHNVKNGGPCTDGKQ